ncbi:MAG: histone deacetylase [Brucellaceae bacterium]|nr:histone deacetylase [Brucellaceae bacterium]
MRLPVVHHPDYDARLPASHRFPMSKYTALRVHLERTGLLDRMQLMQPAAAPREWLTLAHDGGYVDRVLTCTVPAAIEREIGFAIDERTSRRAQLATAGTVLAARTALDSGIACNMAGGSHHARFEQGAGYCTFNDVAVAALVLLAAREIARALVIDCDVHQGDGTARILAGDERVFTVSMHCDENYPVRKAQSDMDVALPQGMTGEAYLDVLRELLPAALDRSRPDIVFYNAGVDVHGEDRLGKLALTNHNIRSRDETVIGFFRERGIPVCGVIGGGYSSDIGALAVRHALLFETAAGFV